MMTADDWAARVADIDPVLHRKLLGGDWIVERCKHCGLAIVGDGQGHGWTHLEGKQRRMTRCAVDPYGYDAAPVGEACSFACLGYEGS